MKGQNDPSIYFELWQADFTAENQTVTHTTENLTLCYNLLWKTTLNDSDLAVSELNKAVLIGLLDAKMTKAIPQH